MDVNLFKEFIRPELFVLIPVLYFAGIGLKNAAFFADKMIPVMLGLVGIVLSAVYIASTSSFAGPQSVFAAIFASITQGVLCAGCSVYVNQIIKQAKK